jgi:hypothetical protein
MEEFLLSSIKPMLPFYLLAFVLAEMLLFVKERKGLLLEILIAAGAGLILAVLGQFQGHSAWAAENRPVLLALVNFLSALMPLFVFVVANQFLVRVKENTQKHVGLLIIVLVTMFIWPLWALYVTCVTGLDCL